MEKLIVSESELVDKVDLFYKEELVKILDEKWNKLSGIEKSFVFEFLKNCYPDKSHLLKEAKWYNTLGDIMGIFDPTGIVDLVNGMSYWRQGDKLYAVLSFVSAIPYLGDVIAKPVVGVMKLGGESTKLFKAAALSGDASKIASAAKKAGGPISKFVEKSPSWISKLLTILKDAVGKVPLIGPRFVKLLEEYVTIFSKASKEMKASSEVAAKLLAKGESTLTKAEKQLLAKELKNASKFKGFSKYAGEGQGFWNKYMIGGMPRLFGNRATRSLMRRTKWYLGLLDFLGVANFVGPDELEQKYGDLQYKMEEYNKTPQAQEYAKEDLSGMDLPKPEPTKTELPKPEVPKKTENDPLSFLTSLLFQK